MRKTFFVAAALFCTAGAVEAGAIERACLRSDRQPMDRSLCGCIQMAADVTLGWRDQRKAAKFFRDPHQAQVVRQSGDPGDERFWLKYRAFGETAKTYCN